MEISYQDGVLQCCAHSVREGMGGHASSSSCRWLQEATCRAESRKPCWTVAPLGRTDELNCHMQKDLREWNRTAPPAPSWAPPSVPPGVNPRGLAGLCQPGIPPGHLLGTSWACPRLLCLFCSSGPAFLQPSKTGRQGVVTLGSVPYCNYCGTTCPPAYHGQSRCRAIGDAKGHHVVLSMLSYRP